MLKIKLLVSINTHWRSLNLNDPRNWVIREGVVAKLNRGSWAQRCRSKEGQRCRCGGFLKNPNMKGTWWFHIECHARHSQVDLALSCEAPQVLLLLSSEYLCIGFFGTWVKEYFWWSHHKLYVMVVFNLMLTSVTR